MTDTRELWFNGGAVHCVTNDQPLMIATVSASSTQPASTTSGTTTKSAASSRALLMTAAAADQQFGLRTTGKLFENWGGRGEKWMMGNDGWYFVTPNGSLYRWNRVANLAEGTLVAQLDSPAGRVRRQSLELVTRFSSRDLTDETTGPPKFQENPNCPFAHVQSTPAGLLAS